MKYRKLKKKYDHFEYFACSNDEQKSGVKKNIKNYSRLYGFQGLHAVLIDQAAAPKDEWESELGATIGLTDPYPEYN